MGEEDGTRHQALCWVIPGRPWQAINPGARYGMGNAGAPAQSAARQAAHNAARCPGGRAHCPPPRPRGGCPGVRHHT